MRSAPCAASSGPRLVRSHPVSHNSFRLHLGIGAADHLEFQIGDDVLQLEGRMVEKISRSHHACFLAAPQGKHQGALRRLLPRQGARQLHHRDRARSVVIGAGIHLAVAHAQVVEMSAEQDDLIFCAAALDLRQHVPGVRHLHGETSACSFSEFAPSSSSTAARRLALQQNHVRSGRSVSDPLLRPRGKLASASR